MNKSIRTLLALLSIVLVASCNSTSPYVPETLEAEGLTRLADGVYVALQPTEGRFNDSNAVVIVGRTAVAVVDTQSDAEFVRKVIAGIRSMTDLPLKWVINTHWHSDHTQGNAIYREEFGDTVSFMAHESLVEDVPRRAATSVTERVQGLEQQLPEARKQLELGLGLRGQQLSDEQQENQRAAIKQAERWLDANRDLVFIAPTETYSETKQLDLGGRVLELLHLQAHTRGDTVVLVPDARILLTGDMLDDMPYVGHGYPRSWITALERLRELSFDRIVPGHGPVFDSRDKLGHVHGFLEALVHEVDAAIAAGKTGDEIAEQIDLSRWRETLAGEDETAGRFFDQTLAEAIERTRLEALGELPD